MFFFQAEDGIRDIGVTGVQTCALPILLIFDVIVVPRMLTVLERATMVCAPILAIEDRAARFNGGEPRSEERRVGKESRSRWLPVHLNKKRKYERQKVNLDVSCLSKEKY